MGLGLNASIYRFPLQFEGETQGQIDDSATTVGPNLSIGYDVLFWNHVLIGIRAEGMLSDTSGMNKDKSSKLYDHTKGKNRTLMGLLRLGYISDFVGTNLVDEKYNMTAEFFLEGGFGNGRNDFTINYEYDHNGITEAYEESIKQTFNSQIIGAGFNVTGGEGAFFEMKVLYQTFTTYNTDTRGTFQENGGTLQHITDNDQDPDPFTSLIVTIGHHY